MLGQNHVRPSEQNPNLLQIHEIFATIQGEGPFSGWRAVFIRLTGCNLRCWWCDTVWDDDNDPYKSTSQIITEAMELTREERPLIVITGGEPVRQDLRQLVMGLKSRNAIVQIETAGSLWQSCLRETVIVVSPKTPVLNENISDAAAYWKYPIIAGQTSEKDGLPVTNTQRTSGAKVPLARPPRGISPHHIFVTPVDLGNEINNLANTAEVARIAQQFGYVAQVQLHKLLRVS